MWKAIKWSSSWLFFIMTPLAVCTLVVSICFPPSEPKFSMYAIEIEIPSGVSLSETGHLVTAKLEAWEFHKTTAENKGGDVIVDANDPLVGRYDGTLRINIQNDRVGRSFRIDLFQPRMRRLSTSPKVPWVLDDNYSVQKVMKCAEECAR